MRLVVGLGNPGEKYRETRHNVGFDAIERLARDVSADVPREKFDSLMQEARIGSERLLLLRPLTYMNLSGKAVRAARDFYKVELDEVLIVCDDFQLELGTLRFRANGSAGGQNGLADSLQQLGTQEVPRLRLGIGPVPPEWSTVDFVLGRFAKDQREAVDEMVARAARGIATWATEGLTKAMNQFN